MANLLGHLWAEREPNWAAALADSSVELHLYGKSKPRIGRKMGHLTATDATPREAVEPVVRAHERLRQQVSVSLAPGDFSACDLNS